MDMWMSPNLYKFQHLQTLTNSIYLLFLKCSGLIVQLKPSTVMPWATASRYYSNRIICNTFLIIQKLRAWSCNYLLVETGSMGIKEVWIWGLLVFTCTCATIKTSSKNASCFPHVSHFSVRSAFYRLPRCGTIPLNTILPSLWVLSYKHSWMSRYLTSQEVISSWRFKVTCLATASC